MRGELVTIAGVDLPKEDVGNALQLLEFCYTFGKIVDAKTGHAEAALKDLIKGSEPELESSESDQSDDDSWLKVLKNCISNSQLKHLDSIYTTAAGYDNLELSTKLGLLIFLCDEVLGT
ncbi:DDT domain, subgroup [Artemisia annua]|uniref:DDT domain, subgroup n=1 Tax=Artemisia annua TaxID=35608 RepID=A0A2U1LJB7_ARTAN|nr:DDT domain, subgroup [Artemisia annua]